MRRSIAMVAALGVLGAPAAARAFCGFYVSGAGADLFNNATQVVLMREGTRTVLSMQNNYQGPPSDFAMVVPVPVVLEKENVKTLPHEIFAPRRQAVGAAPGRVLGTGPVPGAQVRGGGGDDDGRQVCSGSGRRCGPG